MTNPEYQRLLRCTPAELRAALPGDGADADGDRRAARRRRRTTGCTPAIRNLGGHDLDALRDGVRGDRRHPADGDLRLHGQGPRPADRGPPAEPLRAADRRPAGRRWPTRLGHRPGRALVAVRRRQSPAGRCCAAAAARLRRTPRATVRRRRRCPADLGRTPHRRRRPPRPRSGRALLDLNRAAPEAGRAGRHRQPGRQLQHQPRRLGQQGRRLVAERAARLVRRRRRDDPALAGAADRPAHRARHRRDQPGRPDRRARRDLEPVGRSRCCRSACSTTRSSSGRWSRGRSASTPAASRSWSARRPG